MSDLLTDHVCKQADEIDRLRARLAMAEAQRRLERIRGVAAEPGQNYVIRLANIVTIIDAPDGFSGPTRPTDSAPADFGCHGCGGNLVRGHCPECNPGLTARAPSDRLNR